MSVPEKEVVELLERDESRASAPWSLAWWLAFGQLFSWGILYYTFTVIIDAIQAETGWTRPFLNGGLSLGLLVWGLSALPIGVFIQRRGGRMVMTGGSLIGGLSLLGMAGMSHPLGYLLSWVGMGIAMGALLYDPAFAVITQTFRSRYREGITLVTLLGGLASTVFIPLIYLLESHLGWRGALQSCGGLLLFLGAPMHWWVLPSAAPATFSKKTTSASARAREWFRTLRGEISNRRFLGLMLWFTAYIGAFSGLTFLIIPLLLAMGVASELVLQAVVIIGPMQVVGRLLLVSAGKQFSSLRVGRWAMGLLGCSLLILLFLPKTLLWLGSFAVLFGMGNGVMTILKGTAPAELFGTERYSELNGALSAPGVLSKAISPLLLAALWNTGVDPKWVFGAILGMIIVGSGSLEILARQEKREPSMA
ncbi:MFS transporter [Roseibacillus persicicus]|uniref:MFS transporter n=1 Tax=Roseibacillus persicicus TaxID=454148 RepID=A0A918TF02_9BACT|nr:MFS transporter [Roseibacillus persicicus]GHC41875.1 MFS transporter [Roseibacillus persicicus]